MATVIIPARLNSSRLPEKVILDLEGKPVIQHVYERVMRCKHVDDVIIATDHEKVVHVAETFTDQIVITSPDHPSGTDRIAEVAKSLQIASDAIIINVQGDEPFIEPDAIDGLVSQMKKNQWQIGTLIHRINNTDQLVNPNLVKCVRGENDRALYFSRAAIPFLRDIPSDQWINHNVHYRHIGVYGFQLDVLLRLAALPPATLEMQEKLEQLRWLSHGFTIHVVETSYEPIGIDTMGDLEAARDRLRRAVHLH